MRAVVLVGGFGTRLRPLTTSVPKPMLPVGHQPIIERLVRNLGRGGVTEVTLALGFKPEPFIAGFPEGRCAGVDLRYAVEPEPLDTAGAIRFAAEQSDIDDTFIVANGDVLTDLDVGELVAFHRGRRAEATLHLIPVGDPSAYGVVALDDDGRVERFVEKPPAGTAPSNQVNAGTYVLEPSVLERIPRGQRTSIERVTFPAIAADRRLFAMSTDDYWLDTGTPDAYVAANLDLLRGRRRHERCDAVAPGAEVDPTAVIDESVVAAGARVGARAVVRRSVLLDGAGVDEAGTVTDSVIMGRVRSRATVTHSVFGVDGEAATGEVVTDERRPSPDGS